MQPKIKNSKDFHDILPAKEEGYQGFNLLCSFESSKIYIDQINSNTDIKSVIKGSPQYINDGVRVMFEGFNDRKPTPSKNRIINENISFKHLPTIVICFFTIVTLSLGLIINDKEQKTILIKEIPSKIWIDNHYIPVDCSITFKENLNMAGDKIYCLIIQSENDRQFIEFYTLYEVNKFTNKFKKLTNYQY